MNGPDREARRAFADELEPLAQRLRAIALRAERYGYRGLEETMCEAAEQAEFAAALARDEASGRYD